MRKLIFIFAIFMLLGLPIKAQFYRIRNEKTTDYFLNTESGDVVSGAIKEGWWSAQWQITQVSPNNSSCFWIINRWQECALDFQNEQIVCNPYNENAKSQQWSMTSKDNNGYSPLINMSNSKYLHQDRTGKLTLEASDKNEGSRWKLAETGQVSSPTVVEAEKITENTESNETEVSNPVSNGGLTQEQIDEFVDSHNIARAAVGSGKVKWNAEIAAYADKWAKHLANERACELDHRQGNIYGENIFQGSDAIYANPQLIVAAWLEEKADYHGGKINDNTTALHYTQLIWAKTTEIGCAIAVCPNGYVISVCNYNPAGNMYGESPLKK